MNLLSVLLDEHAPASSKKQPWPPLPVSCENEIQLSRTPTTPTIPASFSCLLPLKGRMNYLGGATTGVSYLGGAY
jgi:hypothetical protein